MQNQRKQRPRVPVMLAGSTVVRGFQKAPQDAPANPAVIAVSPQAVAKLFAQDRTVVSAQDFHKLFGDASPREEKVLTLDDVAPVAMPFCSHWVRLTKNELIFQSQYKRKYNTPKSPPISFECIKCHPVCIHGVRLSEKEIDSGKRFSANCPVCVGKVGSAENLETYLTAQKLTEGWGWSPVEHEFTTSYGLRITKSGKNLCYSGSSKQIEQTDASNVETIDDGKAIVAVHVASGPSRVGRGPDDEHDDSGWNADESGDPVSFTPSETIKSFEQARKESTKEILELSRHKVEKRDGYWALVTNGIEVNRFATKKDAARAFAELTELDRLTFKNNSSKRSTEIEHQNQDVMATESEETTIQNRVVELEHRTKD